MSTMNKNMYLCVRKKIKKSFACELFLQIGIELLTLYNCINF